MSETPRPELDVPKAADAIDDADWRRHQALLRAAETDSILRVMLEHSLPLTPEILVVSPMDLERSAGTRR